MSQTVSINDQSLLAINTDTRKIFIGHNRYEDVDYTNPDGDYASTDMLLGTVIGRIASSGKVVPLDSAASDGSQYPIGVLAKTYTVEAGGDQTVSICVAGDVAEEKVLLQGTDTLETIIDSRRLRDRIAADTVGIKLVTATEMTDTDNA